MRKIYTKQGDKGETAIFGGTRVPKDNVRIDANGELDELNSRIGLVRFIVSEEIKRDESRAKTLTGWEKMLHKIQMELMSVMSNVSTLHAQREKNPNPLNRELTSEIEKFMDEMMSEMTENGFFILPGGTYLSSQLHLARTQARRAERRLCTLNRIDKVDDCIMTLINRLSDLFFIMARHDMHSQNWSEDKWQEFGYKRKKKVSPPKL